MADPVVLDETDRRLVHALALDGRAPFRRIAEVLGLSERLVVRRYGRLRERLALRLVGVLDAHRTGAVEWFTRIAVRPEGLDRLATLLARRDNVSWLATTAGRPELTCLVRTPRPGAGGASLLDLLAARPDVGETDAACLLAPVAGVGGWPGRLTALTVGETAALARPEPGNEPVAGLGDEDRRLARMLAVDARTTAAHLAEHLGVSATTVRRRVAELRARGLMHIEVEIDPGLYGHPVEALARLEVEPARLDEVSAALAGHPEVAFAAVTTGSANVVAVLELTGTDALHGYLAHRLGPLPGIRHAETWLTGRRITRSGAPLLSA